MLFEFGSIGYEFFIILSGAVSIYITLKGETYEEDKATMLESPDVPFPRKLNGDRWKSKFKGVPKSPANIYSTVLRKATGYQVLHKDFWLKNVNTIPAGASFGEVAIMGKQLCTRNATIFCTKECLFAVLDKDNF